MTKSLKGVIKKINDNGTIEIEIDAIDLLIDNHFDGDPQKFLDLVDKTRKKKEPNK